MLAIFSYDVGVAHFLSYLTSEMIMTTEEQMTDEQAINTLNAERWAYVGGWDDSNPTQMWTCNDKPDTAPHKLEIVLDGRFTLDQLLAIVHFHPGKA